MRKLPFLVAGVAAFVMLATTAFAAPLPRKHYEVSIAVVPPEDPGARYYFNQDKLSDKEKARARLDMLRRIRDERDTPPSPSLTEPRPELRAAPHGDGADWGLPDIDINYCLGWDAAYYEGGVTYSHEFFCQARDVAVVLEFCHNGKCRTVGEAKFTIATIGQVFPGQRKIYFGTIFENWEIEGAIKGVPLALTMDCWSTDDAACVPDDVNNQTHTIGEWMEIGAAPFFFTSPASSGEGPAEVSHYQFETQLALPLYGDTLKLGENQFRCDSAYYLQGGRGCVFNNVTEIFLGLDINDDEVREASVHVLVAQFAPNSTYPLPAEGETKEIPGSIPSFTPLSRETSQQIIDRNRGRSKRACKKLHKPEDSKINSYDCDEYPMASTQQGAASPMYDFSVRYIPSDDNQAAGRRLGKWYDKQRILDEDKFYVYVDR